MGTVQSDSRLERVLGTGRDRDDTRYVFEFFRAVNGQSMGGILGRFVNSEFGRSQIEDRTRFAEKLLDRETLKSYGRGTFAAAYLHYLDTENLDPLGVHVAAVENAPELYAQLEREYPEFAATDLYLPVWPTTCTTCSQGMVAIRWERPCC